MALNNSLISKFVKTTSNTKNTKKETFLHGYIVTDANNRTCVKVSNYGEGSDSYIPVKVTTNVNVEQPVTVMIKNHTATVIGNAAEVDRDKDNKRRLLNKTSDVIDSIPDTEVESLWTNYFNE